MKATKKLSNCLIWFFMSPCGTLLKWYHHFLSNLYLYFSSHFLVHYASLCELFQSLVRFASLKMLKNFRSFMLLYQFMWFMPFYVFYTSLLFDLSYSMAFLIWTLNKIIKTDMKKWKLKERWGSFASTKIFGCLLSWEIIVLLNNWYKIGTTATLAANTPTQPHFIIYSYQYSFKKNLCNKVDFY